MVLQTKHDANFFILKCSSGYGIRNTCAAAHWAVSSAAVNKNVFIFSLSIFLSFSPFYSNSINNFFLLSLLHFAGLTAFIKGSHVQQVGERAPKCTIVESICTKRQRRFTASEIQQRRIRKVSVRIGTANCRSFENEIELTSFIDWFTDRFRVV